MNMTQIQYKTFLTISVIVPVYNISNYLSKCVNSILNQTYRQIELILVDDGSSDGSSSICDSFALADPRVIVLHKQNSGVSDCRNIGIANSKGQYLCFVDGDDYFSQLDYFEKQIGYLLKYRPEVLINTYNIYFDKDTIIYPFKKYSATNIFILDKQKAIFELFKERMFNHVPVSKFYNRDSLLSLRFNNDYAYGEDLLFAFEYLNQLSNQSKIIYNSMSSYTYVQRYDSACHSYSIDKRLGVLKIYQSIMSNLDSSLANYVYVNNYLRFCIKLKYRILSLKTEKTYEYIELLNKITKKNSIKNAFAFKTKFKVRILLIINLLPNAYFATILKFLRASTL